jgi:hypothetical protein
MAWIEKRTNGAPTCQCQSHHFDAMSRLSVSGIHELGSQPLTQMLLDGWPHPPSVGPHWLGHSVGTWDGDTLVVDAIGFHDRGRLNFDGHPRSDKLHVTERLRRSDLGYLEIEMTLDDQGAFRKPWTGTKYATLAPDVELQEYICNEQQRRGTPVSTRLEIRPQACGAAETHRSRARCSKRTAGQGGFLAGTALSRHPPEDPRRG